MKIEETFRKRLKSLRLKLQLVHEEEGSEEGHTPPGPVSISSGCEADELY